jgi:hypothetical protein
MQTALRNTYPIVDSVRVVSEEGQEICGGHTSPPFSPVMRRLGADLEEKPKPRVALLAEAQKG